MSDQRLRLADLFAALSVSTDLGMGQPPEKAIRSCLLATGLARAMDLPEAQVRDVYLASLLRHLGCTATAALEARLYGDELVSRRAAEPADFGSTRETLALALGAGRGAGLLWPRVVARAVAGDIQYGKMIFRSICDAGSLLAGRLGLGEQVQHSLFQQFERWDGKGAPHGLAKDEITLAARISEVATQAILSHQAGGPDAAVAMVELRAGGWLDPSVADIFRRRGTGLLREIDVVDLWEAVLAAEPPPVRHVAPMELDRVARTFADMVDLHPRALHGGRRAVRTCRPLARAGRTRGRGSAPHRPPA